MTNIERRTILYALLIIAPALRIIYEVLQISSSLAVVLTVVPIGAVYWMSRRIVAIRKHSLEKFRFGRCDYLFVAVLAISTFYGYLTSIGYPLLGVCIPAMLVALTYAIIGSCVGIYHCIVVVANRLFPDPELPPSG